MRTNTFRVVALSTPVAQTARDKAAAGASNHKLSIVQAEQSAPCRHCLTWAKPGERVILFPFQAIASDRPYAESGSIFVHADPCARYEASDEFPPELRNGRAVRAYNNEDEIIAGEIANGAPEETAARLLQDERAKYLHVRSATHGCYTFKVERA